MINEYSLSQIDLSMLKEFILQNGTLRQIARKDYLIRQNETSPFVGFITEGMFRYTRTDSAGKEHIIGYSFKDDFIGEYSANLCHRSSIANIQAIKDSSVYLVRHTELERFWNLSAEHQHLGRIVAEQLFVMTYRRLIDSYCSTPEERYIDLMKRYPDLKEMIPLKEIASFIGVTPETVSSIRRKLLNS